MSVAVVELRCPLNPSRLFAKLRTSGAQIVSGNLIEVACNDCRGPRRTVMVLHRYDVLGELVETETIRVAG